MHGEGERGRDMITKIVAGALVFSLCYYLVVAAPL
jgi:hypothetical protein